MEELIKQLSRTIVKLIEIDEETDKWPRPTITTEEWKERSLSTLDEAIKNLNHRRDQVS